MKSNKTYSSLVYKLKIISEAKAELAHELRYSRNTWGQSHARQYAQALRARIKDLQTRAREYPQQNDILKGIRILNYKGNRIIYTINEKQKTVIVSAVMGHARNIDPRILKQRQDKE